MGLHVRQVTFEDVPSLTNVHYEAIVPDYLTKLLFRDANPQELKDFMIDSFGKSVKNESKSDSTTRYLVVVDPELNGQIIAWAHWVIPQDEESSNSADSSEESHAKEVQKEPGDQKTQEEEVREKQHPKGLDASLQAAFGREIAALRERCLKDGRRHWSEFEPRRLPSMMHSRKEITDSSQTDLHVHNSLTESGNTSVA